MNIHDFCWDADKGGSVVSIFHHDVQSECLITREAVRRRNQPSTPFFINITYTKREDGALPGGVNKTVL